MKKFFSTRQQSKTTSSPTNIKLIFGLMSLMSRITQAIESKSVFTPIEASNQLCFAKVDQNGNINDEYCFNVTKPAMNDNAQETSGVVVNSLLIFSFTLLLAALICIKFSPKNSNKNNPDLDESAPVGELPMYRGSSLN